MEYTIVSIGDSIMWGQGLRTADKFVFTVARAIETQLPAGSKVNLHQYAHSTTRVWKDEPSIFDDLPPCAKKLPIPRTPQDQEILQQKMPFSEPEQREAVGELLSPDPFTWNQIYASSQALKGKRVDLVLLNAGINDVGLLNLFLPYKTLSCVLDRILSFRGYTTRLLERIHRDFPVAKILVTGYYPILSEQTNFDFFWRWILGFFQALRKSSFLNEIPQEESLPEIVSLLNAESTFDIKTIEEISVPFIRHLKLPDISFAGIFLPPLSVEQNLVNLSRLWAWKIHEILKEEVETYNSRLGTKFVALAIPEFRSKHCLYAPESMLWELNDELEPLDAVADYRKQLCRQNALLYYVCYRASLGHPNVAGSKAYRDAIMKQLNNW